MARAFEAASRPARAPPARGAARGRGARRRRARAPVGGAARRARRRARPGSTSVDLRVDDDPEPLVALDRLLDLARRLRPRRRSATTSPARAATTRRATPTRAPARSRRTTTSCCSGPAWPPRRPATCRLALRARATARSSCGRAGQTCSDRLRAGHRAERGGGAGGAAAGLNERGRASKRDGCTRKSSVLQVIARTKIAQAITPATTSKESPHDDHRSNHHLDRRHGSLDRRTSPSSTPASRPSAAASTTSPAASTSRPATPRLTGEVDVPSIQVKDENLYGHLQSPDFFDTGQHAEDHLRLDLVTPRRRRRHASRAT